MREIVLFGDPEWLNERIGLLQVEVDRIAHHYGLPVHWETAEDPFFLPTAKGKACMIFMWPRRRAVGGEKSRRAVQRNSISKPGSFQTSKVRQCSSV
jgi:hypothetical protein